MPTATENPFPLASEKPYGDDSAPKLDGSDIGASGDSSKNSVSISQGGMVAIIVVVVVVILLGVSSAALFYIAKKREWKVRERIRKSTRKVITAMTPRRSEFPSSVKGARTRLNDVPPTPRLRPEDVEKGMALDVKRKWGK